MRSSRGPPIRPAYARRWVGVHVQSAPAPKPRPPMTLAQLPGYFTAAWLIERMGRKFVLVVYLLGTAATDVIDMAGRLGMKMTEPSERSATAAAASSAFLVECSPLSTTTRSATLWSWAT